eukprot:scaffold285_cov330-Pavlova_lutheri.AAC.16
MDGCDRSVRSMFWLKYTVRRTFLLFFPCGGDAPVCGCVPPVPRSLHGGTRTVHGSVLLSFVHPWSRGYGYSRGLHRDAGPVSLSMHACGRGVMSSFPPLSPRCIASFRFVSMVGWRWEKRDPGLGCLCTREGIDDVTFPRVTDPTTLGYVPWDRSEDGFLSPLWVGSVLGSTAKHVGRERGGGTFRHPPTPTSSNTASSNARVRTPSPVRGFPVAGETSGA